MPGSGDARRTMDVDADVVIAAAGPFAGVEAHPYADLGSVRPCVLGDASLGQDRGRDCGGRAVEDREEAVALGTDLDASRVDDGLAKDAAVVRQEISVPVLERLDEARRTLDVGEEEGDRPGRQCSHLRFGT